jgi:hypothetical protein
MAKISRIIVIVVCVISCISIAASPVAKPIVRAQAKKPEPVDDPYKDSTILVEAFVVEVRLSALYDLGVSPIGEKPNSVSIDNILRCLQDDDNARIVSGAKVAIRQRERGNSESEQRMYLGQKAPTSNESSRRAAVSRSSRPYQFNKSLSVSANILTHNRIYVSFSYNGNSIEKTTAKDDMPPDSVNWEWSSAICLERGKASIAGATQDDKKVVFLILCADIKDS